MENQTTDSNQQQTVIDDGDQGWSGEGTAAKNKHASEAVEFLSTASTDTTFAAITMPEPFSIETDSQRSLVIVPLGQHDLRLQGEHMDNEFIGQEPFSLNYLPAGEVYHVSQSTAVEHLFLSVSRQHTATIIEKSIGEVEPMPKALLDYRDHDVWMAAQSIRRFLVSPHCSGPAYLDGQTSVLLSHVFSQLVHQPNSNRRRNYVSLTDGTLKAILAHIDKTFSRRVSVVEICEEFNLNPFRFAKHFKLMMGCTPGQYIINRRITEARRLLLDKSRSIADIAYEVGFSSQAHLTTTFKAQVGITPGQYRDTYANTSDN